MIVEDTYGTHSVKLPAGHMILYPSTSLHHVRPVTRGARIASFFWIQSMVRDDGERSLLFDLDLAIQRINRDIPIIPPPCNSPAFITICCGAGPTPKSQPYLGPRIWRPRIWKRIGAVDTPRRGA